MTDSFDADSPAVRQTRAARRVLGLYGAGFLRLFTHLCPDDTDLLVESKLISPEPGSRAADLQNSAIMLGAYIKLKLLDGRPHTFFPEECARTHDERRGLVPNVIKRLKREPDWSEVMLGHTRAQGSVYTAVKEVACTGCPITACVHRRTKSKVRAA